MGGRANPLRDAAAIVVIGQTEFAKQMSLERYGFCGRGEAAAFVADGSLRWDTGSLPVNTSTSQVEGTRHCLVTSGEGVPTSAIVPRAA
jgi:hypothetical protein